jgi:hypothetical protein
MAETTATEQTLEDMWASQERATYASPSPMCVRVIRTYVGGMKPT